MKKKRSRLRRSSRRTPSCHPSEPGQSPPASLLLSSLTTALSELSGAGEHTIDRASGVQEQASERPPSATVLC